MGSRPADAPTSPSPARRAFYLLEPGGWRDYFNLLHLPYTIWHLSYVVIGAALVAGRDYTLLGWTLAAFMLAMGISAHALDELRGRPLKTQIPGAMLIGMGIGGTAMACAVGVFVGLQATIWVLPLILIGGFSVVAYNMEIGPFHRDLVFAIAWGAFPVVTSYVAQARSMSIACVIWAVVATALSQAQRTLSKRARFLRRSVCRISGEIAQADGSTLAITRSWLVDDEEKALLTLCAAVPLIAIGMLLQ